MALCTALQVHRWLGVAFVLLDLPRRDGCGYGNLLRLRGWHAVAELHECLQPRTGIHDGGCDSVYVWRGLYRTSRRHGVHGREYCDQRDPDIRADRICRYGDRLSDEPRTG